MPLPALGSSREDVLAALETFRADDVAWRTGRVLAYVYDPGEEIEATSKASISAANTRPLRVGTM